MDIKKYSLGEIGAFFQAIVIQESEEKRFNVISATLAARGKGKAVDEFTNALKVKLITQAVIEDDWSRLANISRRLH
jgi:hypothetical protein